MILFIFLLFFGVVPSFFVCPFYLSVSLLVIKRIHIYEKQTPVEGDMLLIEVLLIVVAYRYETLYAAFGHFVFVPAQGGNTEIGYICRLFKVQIT